MGETVMTWMGIPLTELSKEELIRAVEHLAQDLDSFYSNTAIHARSLGRVEMIKRGEIYD